MSAILRNSLMVVLLSSTAFAHKPSDSYLQITCGQPALQIRWDIALRDLELLVGLDVDQNGDITWGELRAQRQAIAAHALSRLNISAEGRERQVRVSDLLVSKHSDGSYAALMLEVDCRGDVRALDIDYSLLFDLDPTHRGLVRYDDGSITSTYVLSPDASSIHLQEGQFSFWITFRDYVREGVWHIWIGFDHILFLLSLLLPAVLMRRERRWEPVEDFLPVGKAVLKLVTVFTLAHSITLWLAVMEYVTLPSRLVEATIALSIVITAIHNLYPIMPVSNRAIAFAFGLIHGFGFANVLLDLGLTNSALALSLLGFNVGVELGQLAIVLVFLPFAFALRSTIFYQRLVLTFGSVLVMAVAGIWMYERVFGAEILGI